MSADDRRRTNLTAALGFLRLPPTEPEPQLLHRLLDTWSGIGLVAVGSKRQGLRLSLTHIAGGEWRSVFVGDSLLLAPRGLGVAPWQAVQQSGLGGQGRGG
jgi:hypothetical protein